MSFKNINKFGRTAFRIPRFTDAEIVERFERFVSECNVTVIKTSVLLLMSDQPADIQDSLRSRELDALLEENSILIRSMTVELNNNTRVIVERPCEGDQQVSGNVDLAKVAHSSAQPSLGDFAKTLTVARKCFGAFDAKPFAELLDEGTKLLYQSRESDLQRLERMQESFFKDMTSFTLDQQRAQQEFQRQLQEDYAGRQSNLEAQHVERMASYDLKEAELKAKRDAIDERDNRQARRDIYKDLKSKIEARNKSFELTEGTQKRRLIPFWSTLVFLAIFGCGFGLCFYRNVMTDGTSQNWVAIVSQIGFAVAFVGMATFFIRWNNLWFQKHADEEFKLKRLDIDIDRANWLVELCMEWQNISKGEIPAELVTRLSRNLFVTDGEPNSDMHPTETLFSSVFSKSGSISLEPGKLVLHRSDEKK